MTGGQLQCWGRAYRNGDLVCGRVQVVIGCDDERLGLSPHERGGIEARFVEHVDAALGAELSELVRRRGSAAQRVAERLDPIEIVVDDPPPGRQRIVGRLRPPLSRFGSLREIEFGLREVGRTR